MNFFGIGETSKFKVVLPPLPEQRAIADILGTWDEAIALTEALIDALQQRKKSLMQKLLTGEVRFPEFEGEWSEKRLKNVLRRVRRDIDVKDEEFYRQIGIRSFGKGIFHKEPVTGRELGNKRIYWVQPDDLIFNIVFAWEGAVALASGEEIGMCGSHRFRTYKGIQGKSSVRFFLRYFQSELGVKQLGDASPGGAGRNRTLSVSEFDNLKVRIPSLREQEKIADVIDCEDELIDCFNEYLWELQQQKKGLMQQLLTGQVRVKV